MSGKILEFIIENAEITIPEFAIKLGSSERTVERNLSKLQKEKKLKRIGPAKGGYWAITEENK